MLDNKDILAVIIFGSRATNLSDEYSDTDVCVVIKDQTVINNDEIKHILSNKWDINTDDYILYSESQMHEMASYGSLFIWHLKLEGLMVYDSGFFANVVKGLSGYRHHIYEIDYHGKILQDIKKSYKKFNLVNELDLSIIFTVFRNTCMILCHFRGVFVFGRRNVFSKALELYPDIPITNEKYTDLFKWKFIYERSAFEEEPLPSSSDFYEFLSEAEKIITYARQHISS